ncbi:VTT domain-containing protein [Candidatus Poribacteria bacterium]|nr:VTT domain-containing protein [Candidatus Poribacteria bacterium]
MDAVRPHTATRLIAISSAILAVGVILSAAWLIYPPGRGLVYLCLYTVLTNTYISLLPYEPFLFYYSALYAPMWVTAAAGVGALLSGSIDYATLNPVLHLAKIRRHFVERRLYRWPVRVYDRAPFLLIVFAALTPFPFYPVKFLALSTRYPMGRYLAALMVGRLPRFYALASVGHAIHIPLWVLVLSFVAMFGVTFLGSKLRRKGARG